VPSFQEDTEKLDAGLRHINETGLCRVLKGLQDGPIRLYPSKQIYKPPNKVLRRLASGEFGRHSLEEKTMMRWMGDWAISVLLMSPFAEQLLGEKLALLLSCMLLDHKVVLVGPRNVGSALALALVCLIWPFRWVHMFMPVAPPCLESVPLFDAPPFVVSATHIPDAWWGESNPDTANIFRFGGECIFTCPKLPGHTDLCNGLKSAYTELKLSYQGSQVPTEKVVKATVRSVTKFCGETIESITSILKDRVGESKMSTSSYSSSSSNLSRSLSMIAQIRSDVASSTDSTGEVNSFIPLLLQGEVGVDFIDTIALPKVNAALSRAAGRRCFRCFACFLHEL